MNEKKQIVDNPLLLTSLFSGGVFYIPTEKKSLNKEELNTENQQVEAINIEKGNVEITKEIVQNVVEIKKIEITESLVINIIIDTELAHWPEKLNEPLKKMMGALRIDGKPLTLADFAVYNMSLFPEVTDISKFISELNTKRVLIWSTKLKTVAFQTINAEYLLANKQVLWLKDILDVMANNESKMEAWILMKKFFQM